MRSLWVFGLTGLKKSYVCADSERHQSYDRLSLSLSKVAPHSLRHVPHF